MLVFRLLFSSTLYTSRNRMHEKEIWNYRLTCCVAPVFQASHLLWIAETFILSCSAVLPKLYSASSLEAAEASTSCINTVHFRARSQCSLPKDTKGYRCEDDRAGYRPQAEVIARNIQQSQRHDLYTTDVPSQSDPTRMP